MGTSRNTTEKGNAGEKLVEEFLQKQGYTILDKKWRPGKVGKLEIDLIAMKDMMIAFVEVKSRSGENEDPIDTVDSKKISNICRAADIYLRELPFLYEYRFDIAGVTDPEGDSPSIEYIENAFLPPFRNR